MRSISRFSAVALLAAAASLPGQEKQYHAPPPANGYGDGVIGGGFYGAGATAGGMAGGYLTVFGTAHSFNPKYAGGLMLELGFAADVAKPGSDGTFAVTYDHTFNISRHFDVPVRNAVHPFADAGYTRFFLGGNAVHFGGGLLWRYSYSHVDCWGVRLEYRGYFLPARGIISTFRISHEWGSNES